MSTPCACGDHAPHVTATRVCADGGRVELWSDGSVTSGFAYVVRGRRAAAPLAAALTACAVLRAWVALYSAAEVEALGAREIVLVEGPHDNVRLPLRASSSRSRASVALSRR